MGFFDDRADVPSIACGRVRHDAVEAAKRHVPALLEFVEVLRCGDDLALVVSGLEAYPTGVAFGVWAVRHPQAPGHVSTLAGEIGGFFDPGHDDPPEPRDRFMIGTRYESGAFATRDGATSDPGAGQVETAIDVLGVSGTADGSRNRFWITPIPDHGDVELVVRWPSRGLPETAVRIPGDALRTAAVTCQPLWPADTDPVPSR